ncbi:MAG: hypothetical protein JRN32_01265 [Nitrososphaerota archaeon]|nr:hypothetical protein [Nitrososphaerota archaeon]MDG7042507.1 hypothetical protein [Nitrososphaerota archaeon]MDG7045430.1 hypothetical protein [Nitrososphaerota archaeon]
MGMVMPEFIPVQTKLAGHQADVSHVSLDQKRSPLLVDEPACGIAPREAHALER